MKSAQSVIKILNKALANEDGILSLQELDNNIIVFFDRKKCNGSFPSQVEGITIIPYDVRQTLLISEEFAKSMQHKAVNGKFKRIIELCTNMLDK